MGRITPKSKAIKIIKLAASGSTATWIHEKKGYDRSYVSKVLKKAVNKKVLIVSLESVVKKYSIGPNYDSFMNGVYKSHSMKPISLDKSVRRRLHATRWKCKVLNEFDADVAKKNDFEWNWDKVVNLRHGVKNYYLYFLNYTVCITDSKKKTTVTIFLNSKLVEAVETDKQLEYVYEDVNGIRDALQKIIGCRLSPPVQIQDAEFASPVVSEQLRNFMSKCKYVKYGDVWIDMSPQEKGGFRWGEIESKDIQKLELMEKLQFSDLLIPQRVDDLEGEMDEVKDLIRDVNSSISELKGLLSKPERKMNDKDMDMYL